MRTVRQRPSSTGQAAEESAHVPISLGHIAHELNSLLDGTVRSLRLARETVTETSKREEKSETLTTIDLRLKCAQVGLSQMTEVLSRVMHANRADVQVFESNHTLAHEMKRIEEAVSGQACDHGVTLHVDVTPRAGILPAGVLGTVIRNCVKNAIEACARDGQIARHVEVSLTIRSSDELMIVISDTGPGFYGGFNAEEVVNEGHGFGLDLSTRVVRSLGGDLRIMNIPFGRGAVVQIVIPVRNLENDEPTPIKSPHRR